MMFLTYDQPDIRPLPSKGRQPLYQLREAHSIHWEDGKSVWTLRIPAGFLCDGASNPWFLWSVTGIPPDGVHRLAALYHDYIYRYSGDLPGGSFFRDGIRSRTTWTRKQTDRFFACLLRETGVGKFRRRTMYLGVRLGGWLPWNFGATRM